MRVFCCGAVTDESPPVHRQAVRAPIVFHQEDGRPGVGQCTGSYLAVNDETTALWKAIRKLAGEAADNGLLDPQIAGGIRAVKGARQEDRRTGNWLTHEEAQDWLKAPDTRAVRGRRDRALLAVLIGCGLRTFYVSAVGRLPLLCGSLSSLSRSEHRSNHTTGKIDNTTPAKLRWAKK